MLSLHCKDRKFSPGFDFIPYICAAAIQSGIEGLAEIDQVLVHFHVNLTIHLKYTIQSIHFLKDIGFHFQMI